MRPDEREKLRAFARGEATWAEVEGITAGEAARIARAAGVCSSPATITPEGRQDSIS